jgi:hypothetical protein
MQITWQCAARNAQSLRQGVSICFNNSAMAGAAAADAYAVMMELGAPLLPMTYLD